MSTERPILFNGAMVRAILSGAKTQTRRAVKNVPSWDHFGKDIMDWDLSGIHQEGYSEHDQLEGTDKWYLDVQTDVDDHSRKVIRCPFGQPGDRLWVRETWMDLTGTGIEHWDTATGKRMRFAYGAESPAGSASDEARKDFGLKWRPSIHMPSDACRLVLEITGVRVERLQAISEVDAKAEGVEPKRCASVHDWRHYVPYGEAFIDLWKSTGGDWDGNPWVWVIEFKKVAA